MDFGQSSGTNTYPEFTKSICTEATPMFLVRRQFHRLAAFVGIGAAAILAGASDAPAQTVPSLRGNLGGPIPLDTVQVTVVQDKDNTGAADTGAKDAPAADATPVEQGVPGFDWLARPKPNLIPRPGFFTVLPTGPGYYSALDILTGNYREKPPTFG